MPPVTPEFSRPVSIADIGEETVLDLDASEAELAQLAIRFGIPAIGRLGARIRLVPAGGGRTVRLEGTYSAALTLTCVVTLEELRQALEGPVSRLYDTEPARAEESDRAVVDIDPDDGEPPDAVIGGLIDVGEAVAEQLALDIDPFPRKADAVFKAPDSGPESGQNGGANGAAEEGAGGPFQALRTLRDKLK